MKLPIATSAAITTIVATSILDPSSTSSSFSMPFQQYSTAADIPKTSIKNQKVIAGRVVKVIDGDTIRIRHYPLYPFLENNSYSGPLSQNSISVRIYGVDAPELAKRGNPSMPKAEDALEWTKSKVDGKVVKVKLLRKDQYGRIVGQVTSKPTIPFFPRNDLSVGLSENGYATLYTGGGAEYNNNREGLEKSIEYAKKKKRGIWVDGEANVMNPADYKRAVKAKQKPTSR